MPGNEKMCIIGFGRMGKRAAQLFSRGFDVAVLSARNVEEEARTAGAASADDPGRAISETDFLFLAVPVEVIRLWVDQINEFSREHCVVMDCCTARIAAESELSLVRRQRFGLPELHEGEIPVIGEPDKRISGYLNQQGYTLWPVTPEDYDRRGAVVGTAHFLGIALELALEPAQRILLGESRAGSFLLQLIEHLKCNSPVTYRETQLLNPVMAEARKNLIEELRDADRELNNGIFRFEPHPPDSWRP